MTFYHYSTEVARALSLGLPVVALESAVLTHGLPHPYNQQLARDLERIIRENDATPATIAVWEGKVLVGLEDNQIESLTTTSGLYKISARDLAGIIMQRGSGGTTVAGTLQVAQAVGIKVFATGGIGGVHRQPPYDISADLLKLANTPVVVVCAGAKAILDLEATLENLETNCVPVIGYQTNDFPAFYSRTCGLQVNWRVESPLEVAQVARNHWNMGMKSAVLVVVPPPAEVALAWEDVHRAVEKALEESDKLGLRGQEVTPHLLREVNKLTGGDSLRANLGLLLNNGRVAAHIAQHLQPSKRKVTG